jgi:hypothetical protein
MLPPAPPALRTATPATGGPHPVEGERGEAAIGEERRSEERGQD